MESAAKIFVPITGMASDHCAIQVDKALGTIPGVVSHQVELNNSRALLGFDTEEIPTQEIVEKIRGIGYNVNSIKKTYPVTGMSCARCAISVESMLKTHKGILNATVNFASNSVLVEFIPGITSPEEIKK
ncbi:MAG: copper ion binding protein, partial [Bacteroidetes bacterium]|nr:copper ion binding protein [Bacteroidota bacterium]